MKAIYGEIVCYYRRCVEMSVCSSNSRACCRGSRATSTSTVVDYLGTL